MCHVILFGMPAFQVPFLILECTTMNENRGDQRALKIEDDVLAKCRVHSLSTYLNLGGEIIATWWFVHNGEL